ncbi:MAG: hypothetical protein E7568_06940 [Ruminococcaceae bacterium]|nr:hypothetical protein [Oscillospiraceae bacterium]
MKILTILFYIGISVYMAIYLLMLVITGKPIKVFILNTLCGWWAFAIVELTSFYTGLHIPLNIATVITTGILGVPGVALTEIMKYIIFI